MKLTEKGKEVWDRRVNPIPLENLKVVEFSETENEIKAAEFTCGIPFGWTVAREALGGLCADDITHGKDLVRVAIQQAIELCNKLAEVEE